MRRCLRSSLFLTAVVLIAVGCDGGDSRSKDMQPPPKGTVREGVAEGNRAPEITGVDADGRGFALSDYRGKVVLLDFWFEH